MSTTRIRHRASLVAALSVTLLTGVVAAQPQGAQTATDQGGGALLPPVGALRAGRSLVAEGAFVANQRGRLHRLDGDWWAFVFAPNSAGPSLPPMPLLPCTNLQAMEQVSGANVGDTTFLLSGQILVYHGQNYLLPTFFQTVESGPEMEPDAEPDAVDTAPAESRDVADPSVEQLLEDLETATESRRPPALPPALDAPPAGLRREGTFISLRRGRLMQRGGGGWELAFDNDAQSVSVHDAPLSLLPCLLLERMEREAGIAAPDATFTVSGRVFVYDGRNYLLPTMFMVGQPRGTKDPRNSGLTTAQ